MCGRQPGPKSPNLKKVWEEAFHPFRKRHTALRRSNEIGNKLFAQVTAEEWVTRIQVNVPLECRHLARRVFAQPTARLRGHYIHIGGIFAPPRWRSREPFNT